MRTSVVRLVALATIVLAVIGCKKGGDDGNNPVTPPPTPPRDQAKAYFLRQIAASNQFVYALEMVCEPVNGSKDTNDARLQWRLSRRPYEMARGFMTEYFFSVHNYVCAWFTQPLYQGFHFLEKVIFASQPNLVSIEFNIENVHASFTNIPANSNNVVYTDAGIFRGMQRTLSDIDTIRFSRLDKQYSDNAYNDIQSNYDGIDSVFKFYDSTIVKADPSASTQFHTALSAARATLLAAGSLDALDIPSYRTHELADLNVALRNAAAKLQISLP